MARREPVVQTSVAMGLSLMRGLPVLQSRAERGAWARGELSVLGMRSVEGMRVGLIGAGVIGSRVAEVWRALGAEVWISDPAHPEHRPWERLAEACDLISLHCSLTPETRGLVDSSFLESMRSGAVLVNTARGELRTSTRCWLQSRLRRAWTSSAQSPCPLPAPGSDPVGRLGDAARRGLPRGPLPEPGSGGRRQPRRWRRGWVCPARSLPY